VVVVVVVEVVVDVVVDVVVVVEVVVDVVVDVVVVVEVVVDVVVDVVVVVVGVTFVIHSHFSLQLLSVPQDSSGCFSSHAESAPQADSHLSPVELAGAPLPSHQYASVCLLPLHLTSLSSEASHFPLSELPQANFHLILATFPSIEPPVVGQLPAEIFFHIISLEEQPVIRISPRPRPFST